MEKHGNPDVYIDLLDNQNSGVLIEIPKGEVHKIQHIPEATSSIMDFAGSVALVVYNGAQEICSYVLKNFDRSIPVDEAIGKLVEDGFSLEEISVTFDQMGIKLPSIEERTTRLEKFFVKYRVGSKNMGERVGKGL